MTLHNSSGNHLHCSPHVYVAGKRRQRVTLDAFVEQGYDATVCRVLAAHPDDIRPVATNSLVKVRPFAMQQDWEDWSRMQLADMPNPAEITSQRYMAHQQIAYRRLIDRGLGNWWGAFIDDEQVGSWGLFFLDGIARFQSVITAPQHRNRNVCKIPDGRGHQAHRWTFGPVCHRCR